VLAETGFRAVLEERYSYWWDWQLKKEEIWFSSVEIALGFLGPDSRNTTGDFSDWSRGIPLEVAIAGID
jgi:hypothetical protein